MFYIYLFATILGGVLLGVSLVAGDHHGGELGHGGHDDHDGSALFSLRVWTYLLAFGGATGLLLLHFTAASLVIGGLCAAGVGVTAGLVARATIKRMITAGSGGTIQEQELVGQTARVLVPAAQGATGTVRLMIKNSTVDVMAICDDGELTAKGDVIIVDMKDGRALVTRSPKDLPALGPKGGSDDGKGTS